MFQYPIQLLNNYYTLTPQCISDLQLELLYDNFLGKPTSKTVQNRWLKYYTTDINFLNETQLLLNNLSYDKNKKNVKDIFERIKNNPSFREKYHFITLEMFDHLNSNPHILQIISMYSLASPILSLMTPLIMLIIPFFILRIKGSSIGVSAYVSELKKVLSMLPIGKLFDFNNISIDQRGFALFSVILYFVQIYQNSITCYKFYKNSYIMVDELHQFANYKHHTANRMETFVNTCERLKLTSYSNFTKILRDKIHYLREVGNQFLEISKNVFRDMGLKMKYYFDIYNDKLFEENMNYAFEFNEYIDDLQVINSLNLSKCQFSKKGTVLKKSYHGILYNKNPIKNTIRIKNKSLILSGPNASGKTTLLKSTAINLILSQQLGIGFYDEAKIFPFDHFHCYINIPDTCGRDSLFQAEARRCRDILSQINKNPNKRHLCVFDELFSGTNPYEAVASAIGYLEYLTNNKNTNFMLTTHYLDLCKHFKEINKKVENYTLEKKYKLNLGISKVRGGINVLEELNFPEQILITAKNLVSLN